MSNKKNLSKSCGWGFFLYIVVVSSCATIDSSSGQARIQGMLTTPSGLPISDVAISIGTDKETKNIYLISDRDGRFMLSASHLAAAGGNVVYLGFKKEGFVELEPREVRYEGILVDLKRIEMRLESGPQPEPFLLEGEEDRAPSRQSPAEAWIGE